MARVILLCGIASCLVWRRWRSAKARRSRPSSRSNRRTAAPCSASANEYLGGGRRSDPRRGNYDDGIRLTKLGLDRPDVAARSGGGVVESVRRACREEASPTPRSVTARSRWGSTKRTGARTAIARTRIYLKRQFDASGLGSRRRAVDQSERPTDAADSRHDERAAPARARHDGGTPIARSASTALRLRSATTLLALASAKRRAARGDDRSRRHMELRRLGAPGVRRRARAAEFRAPTASRGWRASRTTPSRLGAA